MCYRMGLPPIPTIGLGRISVSSASRVPKPPARMATFMVILLLVQPLDSYNPNLGYNIWIYLLLFKLLINFHARFR